MNKESRNLSGSEKNTTLEAAGEISVTILLFVAFILPAFGMGPRKNEESPQVAESEESVESKTDTAVEAGDKAQIKNEVMKELHSLQKTVQKQYEAEQAIEAKTQDRIANTLEKVEKIEQHTTTITQQFGISSERKELEQARWKFLWRYKIYMAGAALGLFILALFAPAFDVNPVVIWTGMAVGLALTAGSVGAGVMAFLGG